MSPRSLYLAGPMRGFDLYNFPAFDEAAAQLRAAGYKVVSPAELDREVGFDEHTLELPDGFVAEAMRRDVAVLLEVDGIALLPGWERSTGARLELALARALDLDVAEVIRVTYDTDLGPSYWHTLSPLTVEAEAAAIARAVEAHNAPLEVLEVDPDNVDIEARLAPWAHVESYHHADGELERLLADEVRVVDASGGAKGSKLARFDMIPPDVLKELAEHYGLGEAKYPGDETGLANWQRGYRWSLSVAALQRHLNAFLQGEDYDPELGDSHLIAVAWHAFALRWWQRHGVGTDDIVGRRPTIDPAVRAYLEASA